MRHYAGAVFRHTHAERSQEEVFMTGESTVGAEDTMVTQPEPKRKGRGVFLRK